MTTNSNFLAISGAFLLAGLIAGCATDASNARYMGGGMGGMGAGQMDMQAMCERHKAMMAGKSPAEQQAMMSDHMKTMSPEMRTRMQSMYEMCKAS